MANSPAVVERLLTRIRQSGDFPAMARTVGLISQLTSSDTTSTSQLADTVLQDYGLTQKVLRLVNSAVYAQYDSVTTISRAVLLMGFERIRNVATGLILFDHLQGLARTPELADALNMSFYSAILGRVIADRTRFADPEEAFISALFHNLGRILVAFYLPEDLARIQSAPAEEREPAVRSVLGMSYSTLGYEIAGSLNLPHKIAQSLPRITGPDASESMGETERLAALSTLANDITDVLAIAAEPGRKRPAIDRLLRSYGRHFVSIAEKIDEIIGAAVAELRDYSTTFRLALPGSAFVDGLGEWRIESLMASPGHATAVVTATAALVDVEEPATADGLPPETVFTHGLHEITSLLMIGATLDDVLRVTLETIYRALGVGRTRVFLLLKDPGASVARFRFGFGQTPAEMKCWLDVPLDGAEDLFSLAARQQKDIVIRDTSAPAVSSLLPTWYRPRVAAGRYVVLLPLVVDRRTVGLFYVDGDTAGGARLTPPILNFLKVLRGQAVLAIMQKAAPRPGPRRS
jgi:eukaryotic-like serine/threonine-protein kinase